LPEQSSAHPRNLERSELFERCPLLEDEAFIAKYPGIERIADYLTYALEWGSLKSRLESTVNFIGANSVNDWLGMVRNEDEAAIKDYQLFKKAYAKDS
jgi:hypothetical protein